MVKRLVAVIIIFSLMFSTVGVSEAFASTGMFLSSVVKSMLNRALLNNYCSNALPVQRVEKSSNNESVPTNSSMGSDRISFDELACPRPY